MDIVILGGTRFVGRALVEAAQNAGHSVTLFHRGKTNPGIFPEVEHLHGDRDGGLGPLTGRRWDAVVDTCGYLPRVVRQSVEALRGTVQHYTFISTLSVYAEPTQPGMDENGPLATMPDETVEEITNETYGPLKVLCEQAVQEAYAERAFIVRPGLIVGPHDPTDRFTYWPARVAQGGEVLAPGEPERLVQFIDVRDLAEWIIRCLPERLGGVFNAVGPVPQPAMGELLEVSRRVSRSEATFTWVDEGFLVEQGVTPWTELPLWIPASEPEADGFFAFDVTRAITAGLRFRSLAETVTDTLAWNRSRPKDEAPRAGLAREREAELLAAWHSRG